MTRLVRVANAPFILLIAGCAVMSTLAPRKRKLVRRGTSEPLDNSAEEVEAQITETYLDGDGVSTGSPLTELDCDSRLSPPAFPPTKLKLGRSNATHAVNSCHFPLHNRMLTTPRLNVPRKDQNPARPPIHLTTWLNPR